ncbi:MAG: NERD domain-containing protein [Phycisphaeraceae bacterium]|nr:NERD domain-containing protein [Phycisphaeraceae bacterium]
MIRKPFDQHEPRSTDILNHAGWTAEKDLAHFLAREYHTAVDIYVFNGLRVPDRAGGFTQIDHLILYRHGIAIIESKSVSGKLTVDRLGQWQRTWRSNPGKPENIADPLAQADRQARSLRVLLDTAEPPLMSKTLGLLQTRFGAFPILTFVAISTNGRFAGHTKPYETSVLKADQITKRINEQIATHLRGSGFKGMLRAGIGDEATDFTLSDAELSRIADYLMKQHTPPATSTRAPSQPTPAASIRIDRLEALSCAKCRSINVQVEYRRDYCLKCADCGKYSPLAYTCPLCGKHAKIRKRGAEFYRDCDRPDGCRQHTVFVRTS